MNKLQGFFKGLAFLVEGLRLLFRTKGLLVFAILPFTIDFLLFVLGLWVGMAFLSGWVAAALGLLVTPAAGIWYTLLFYPLALLVWLVFLILLSYAVFVSAAIVAAPFHSLLAERALMSFGAIQHSKFQLGPWLKSSVKMLGVSLVKGLVFALVGLFVFILSFIPLLNLVGSFLASLIVAFDTMDYSFEVKTWGFKTRIHYFRNHFNYFSGMGVVLALTLMIPGLILLLYPAAVVGSASLLAQSTRSAKELA